MSRKSFRDPASSVLKAHGYAQSNEAGDIDQAEADSFALEPGKWAWDSASSSWLPFVDAAKADRDELAALINLQWRVVEELIQILAAKNVIAMAEFPTALKNRVLRLRQLRQSLGQS